MHIGLMQMVSALVALLVLLSGAFTAGTAWNTRDATQQITASSSSSAEAFTSDVVVEEIPSPVTLPLYKVLRVSDGDTLAVEIDGKSQTVRLIGIDSPELNDSREGVQCFAEEATAEAKRLASGTWVRLEMDPSQGERDKYKRLLAYVFREDGLFINKKMIEGGFAQEYTYNEPYTYQKQFKAAQAKAQDAERGLWAKGACPPKTSNTPAPTKTVSQKSVDAQISNTNQAAAAAAAAAPTPPATVAPLPLVQISSPPAPAAPPIESPPPHPSSAEKKVESPLPLPPTPPASGSVICSTNTYNCSDFKTQQEAQAVYDQCGGVANDVHRLDKNKDGHPCDSLP